MGRGIVIAGVATAAAGGLAWYFLRGRKAHAADFTTFVQQTEAGQQAFNDAIARGESVTVAASEGAAADLVSQTPVTEAPPDLAQGPALDGPTIKQRYDAWLKGVRESALKANPVRLKLLGMRTAVGAPLPLDFFERSDAAMKAGFTQGVLPEFEQLGVSKLTGGARTSARHNIKTALAQAVAKVKAETTETKTQPLLAGWIKELADAARGKLPPSDGGPQAFTNWALALRALQRLAEFGAQSQCEGTGMGAGLQFNNPTVDLSWGLVNTIVKWGVSAKDTVVVTVPKSGWVALRAVGYALATGAYTFDCTGA